MRKCFLLSRILIQRPLGCRGLKTVRKPNVEQLNNAELSRIIQESKEDSQEHGLPSQKASLLIAHILQLPQSPLTARGFRAARIRYRAPKSLPSGDRSLFQSKLQKNPYAIALATPPRLCVFTGLRLPSYFLIPFGVATHPKTGAPWHLPKLPTQINSDSGAQENSSVGCERSQPSLQPCDSSVNPETLTRTLSSSSFLASRQVLAHVADLTPSKYIKLMPQRWRQDPSVKLPDIVWREDMDTFVLDILRRNVLKTLSYLATRPAAYVLPCKSCDDINNYDQVAAVLWLRNDSVTSTNEEPSIDAALSFNVGMTGPPPYAMHYYRTFYIPCYNLAALLGPTQLGALQETRPDRYSDQFALIKRKRNTVKVQLEMWKLLGYIAQDTKHG